MREPKAMGRPREFDEEEVLTRIMEVFWAKGFEGATTSDLVRATGLMKGSLYGAFGDKRAMYLKALALYDRTAIAAAVALLRGGGPPERRIAAFLQAAIDAVAKRDDRRGCFLCNASIDQAVPDPQTRRLVKASLGRLARALDETLGELAGAPSGKAQRQAETQHLLAVHFGLRALAKAGHPLKALRDAKARALRGIVPSA